MAIVKGNKLAKPKQEKAKKDVKPKRPYPTVTLKDALIVAQKIKELNGGNPWDTAEVAKAVEMGARSPKFFYLTAASRDFGLTVGSRDTDKIELTELGREIVYAPNQEVEHQKKVEAYLGINIFKQVLDHYKGSSLPEMRYLGNTLERQFKLDPAYHEEFSKLFRENCKDLGITSGGTDSTENSASTEEISKPSSVVVGIPKGGDVKKKSKAFIIMPFVEKDKNRPGGFFSEVLRCLLTPAGIAAGFVVSTANRQGSDVIQSTIINDLMEADLVIADLTDHNPNVLFELGVRMATDKPVALIKATGTGRIFDIDNMLRVYEYNSNLWQSTLETDIPAITEHIKGAWENRESNQSYIKLLKGAQ